MLITIGFIVLQSLMEKLSRTIYRTVFKSEEIDFDNLEPEIVLKDKEK